MQSGHSEVPNYLHNEFCFDFLIKLSQLPYRQKVLIEYILKVGFFFLKLQVETCHKLLWGLANKHILKAWFISLERGFESPSATESDSQKCNRWMLNDPAIF